MSGMLSVAAIAVVGALVIAGIVVALAVLYGRRKNDWAGDPLPPQPPSAQPPPVDPPRRIDDTERFREQNRPTDPPPPA